ncbi:hypothetical protein MMEU_4320 [Mycobacterium marinum str. Europe]|nr:hypothetical protein MMEU_4320 [Mycobacterium marinum str. Europe]
MGGRTALAVAPKIAVIPAPEAAPRSSPVRTIRLGFVRHPGGVAA